MVVVHPGCYRRDLYENDDMDDDSPWFCSRCRFILDHETGAKLYEDTLAVGTIPNCFLCPDLRGSLIDLLTKEWVHHTCVNWHNEIWFE